MTIYEVNYWGSHPDEGNDDCWSGSSFQNLDDAIEEYWAARKRDGYFAELLGADGKRMAVRQVVSDEEIRRDREREDREWRREIAMEAGMLGGVMAYNDAMGYPNYNRDD
jgi:hypothetical protein